MNATNRMNIISGSEMIDSPKCASDKRLSSSVNALTSLMLAFGLRTSWMNSAVNSTMSSPEDQPYSAPNFFQAVGR